MTQLRSCYFCGTTGTLSEYETVPAALRTEATSRQVVLCDRCHTKLTEVVRPIVDRLESGAASERDAPGGDQSSDPDVPRPSDDRSTQPEVTFAGASERDPADRTPDGPAGTGDPVDDADTAGGTEEEAASERQTAVGSLDAEAAEAAGAAEANGSGTDGLDGTDDTDGAGDDDAESSDDAAERSADAERDEPDTDDGSGAAGVGGRDDLDRVYNQLLRFLRNREFPIPRPEAETVAQSAYDLTANEARQVVQRAIDREVLDERDGQLHRN